MMRGINHEYYGDKVVVNCATCHQGQPQPVASPAIAQGAWQPLEKKVAGEQPVTLPQLEEVLEKYLRAIGGKAAVEGLRTQMLKSTRTSFNKMTPPQTSSLEVYKEAPNKLLVIATLPGVVTYQGFNGTVAWVSYPGEHREVPGAEALRLQRRAEFYGDLKLSERYRRLSVLGKERLGEREAFVMEALPADEESEKLYFDSETGLLVRRRVDFKTVLGVVPEVTGYEDYRAVDGIKLPFTIRWSRPPNSWRQKFTEIRHQLVIERSKFDLPAQPR